MLIPPLGVVMRQSTDVLAISDADLAAAVRFIREHACDGIAVDDVVRQIRPFPQHVEAAFCRDSAPLAATTRSIACRSIA